MDIAIINEKKSTITEQEDSELISVAFLFANGVHFATNGASFFTLHNHYNEFKDYQKCELLKSHVPKYDSEITPKEIDEHFALIQRLKKKRGKIIEEMKLLKITEDVVRILEGMLFSYCKDYLKYYGILNILPYARANDTNIIKLWNLKKYNPDSVFPDFFLHCVASNLYHEFEFPFFPASIEHHTTRTSPTETSPIQDEKGILYLSEPMFVLPFAKKLESNQIVMLRNDIQALVQSWHNLAVDKATELMTVPFQSESFPVLQQILHELQQACLSVQSCVDNHPFTELMQNNDEQLTTYSVHIAITSMENIISLYERLGVITPHETPYVREEVGSNVNLLGCGMFLFLQPNN